MSRPRKQPETVQEQTTLSQELDEQEPPSADEIYKELEKKALAAPQEPAPDDGTPAKVQIYISDKEVETENGTDENGRPVKFIKGQVGFYEKGAFKTKKYKVACNKSVYVDPIVAEALKGLIDKQAGIVFQEKHEVAEYL